MDEASKLASVVEETEATFTYEQLSDRAKDRAYEKWYEDEPGYDWWDSTYEMLQEDGLEKGFVIDTRVEGKTNDGKPVYGPDIYFTLNYSQGDEATWQGHIRVSKWFEAQNKALEEQGKPVPPDWALLQQWFACNQSDDIALVKRRHCGGGSYTIDVEASVTDYSADDFSDEPAGDSAGFFAGLSIKEFAQLALDAMERCSLVEMLQKAADDFAGEIYAALRSEYEYLTSREMFEEMCESNDWRFDEDGELV